MVTEYLNKANLMADLEALGFYLVGYGCTTCIGNSGPLPEPISQAINEHDLVAAAVLSGNRNFEGRISPDIKANYLASPPLVVAYAIAGSVNIDLTNDPIGIGEVMVKRFTLKMSGRRKPKSKIPSPSASRASNSQSNTQTYLMGPTNGRLSLAARGRCTDGTTAAPTFKSRRSLLTLTRR